MAHEEVYRLIAIMLGRLKMSVEDCIAAYTSLSKSVFTKKRQSLSFLGKVQGKFDSAALEAAVQRIAVQQGYSPDELLKDSPDANCKVYEVEPLYRIKSLICCLSRFVCATGKDTGKSVRFTSYRSPRGGSDLLNTTKIWESCRATSAAPSFFDPIAIGPFREEFVDGGTGTNNPVWALWEEAQSTWGPEPIGRKIQCLVSIGTGMPSLKGFGSSAWHHAQALIAIATETEDSAEQFRRDKQDLHAGHRYFRFNVLQGLENVGLEEVKDINVIAQATSCYVASQEVVERMQQCRNGPIVV